VGEARSCLRALAVPFFHHELVKQALLAAMEEPAAAPALLGLLKALADSADVSALQMQKARPWRQRVLQTFSVAWSCHVRLRAAVAPLRSTQSCNIPRSHHVSKCPANGRSCGPGSDGLQA